MLSQLLQVLPSKTKTSFMPTQITVISTRTGLYLTLKPAVLPLRPKKRNWLNATELSDDTEFNNDYQQYERRASLLRVSPREVTTILYYNLLQP